MAARDTIPAELWAEVLPASVLQRLPVQGTTVFRVAEELSDTQACSAAYAIALEDCANTLVLRYKTHDGERHAAAVTLATRRLDVNGLVRASLGAQKVSFADRAFVAARTGMESGGITAFGLPPEWLLLVDAAVMQRERIVMGAGPRLAKLEINPSALLGLPRASVVEITKPLGD